MRKEAKRLTVLVLAIFLVMVETTSVMAADGAASENEAWNVPEENPSMNFSQVLEDKIEISNDHELAASIRGEAVEDIDEADTGEDSAPALGADVEGECGNDLKWSYNAETFTLTFTGSGDMWDYNTSKSTPPWYSYRKSVQHVVMPDSVTRIGAYAFYQFSVCFETFPIPSSLEGIGDGAFYNSGFQQAELSFPANTAEIGASAFYGCTGIQSVVIPDAVSNIGESSFRDCTNLRTINFTPTLQSIESSAFWNCTSLQSVTFPEGIKTIGGCAFYGCTALTGDLELPQSLTSLGNYAFDGCTGYEGTLIIRSGLTSIPYEAFCNCKFRNITLPSTLRTIGSRAFYNHQASKIVVPGIVTSIESQGLYGSNLRSVYFRGNAPSTFYSTSCGSTSLVKLYYINGRTAWKGSLDGYTAVAVSESDIPVNDNAGETIPDMSPVSGECGNNLTYTVTGNKAGRTLAFNGRGDMWDYQSYDKVPWYSYHTTITKIIVPEGVTRIGGYAFCGMSCVYGDYPIPSTVTSIGSCAFKDSDFSANRLKLPDGITTIGDGAFRNDRGLESITFPEGIKTIGGCAFYGCTALTGDLELPQSLTSLGNYAFDGCTGYEGTLIIRSGLTSIPYEAFCNCKFRNITLPSTLRTIGSRAFYNHQASKIVVPGIVTSIESQGLYGSNLRSVYFRGNAPSTFYNTSCGSTADVKLYYLADKSGWSGTFGGYTCIEAGEEDFPDAGSSETATIAVTGVTLDKTEAEMSVGQSVTLKETVLPTNATNTRVIWSSGDESVATVSQMGIVTGVSGGTADITVTTMDGELTAICKITVIDALVPVSGVSLNKTEAEIVVGDILILTPAISPDNAENTNVTWSSNNRMVARVDAYGGVTAIAGGTAVITVTTEDGGKTASCIVTVREEDSVDVVVTGITLETTTAELRVGDSLELVAAITPENASNKGLIWESSKPAIATVDQTGMVTAVAAGETVIVVSSEMNENIFAACTINVTKSGGDEPEPKPEPVPEPESDKYTVVFYVEDDEVHKEEVSSGDIVTNVPEAVGEGIFAGWYTAEDSLWDPTMPVLRNLELEARFVMTEEENTEQIHSGLDPTLIVQNEEDLYMVKGQSAVLDSSESWTSGNRNVINVSGKYKITAKGIGQTTVISGDDSRTYNVFVVQPSIYQDGEPVKKSDVVLGNIIELSVGNLGDYDRSTGTWEYEDFYDITWQSSNAEVAKVDNGLVYGLAKGNTNITAYIGGKAYTCKVTVKDIYSVSEYAGALNLTPLQTVTVKYSDGFKVKNGTWTSSLDMKAAYKNNNTVDYYQDNVVRITPSGKLTAIGKGTTELTVTNNGKSKSFKVTVSDKATNAIYLNAGKSKTIKYYNVKNSGQLAASWSIDPVGTYSTVTQKGVVKGTVNKYGRSVVTCSYDPYLTGGFIYKTDVYTENPSITTEGGMTKKDKIVGITKTAAVQLSVGDTFPIQMTGTAKPVLFTSNKNAVAFVDEAGVISARGKGKANLTARINGVKYTVQVIVTE